MKFIKSFLSYFYLYHPEKEVWIWTTLICRLRKHPRGIKFISQGKTISKTCYDCGDKFDEHSK